MYHIRRDLSRIRRAASPLREVVNDLSRRFLESPELSAYYGDTYDHALRASEWIDTLRDTISFIVETNLSLQDARMNEIMKKLAGWAAIISVPTLITGFFGQNLPFLGSTRCLGWWCPRCFWWSPPRCCGSPFGGAGGFRIPFLQTYLLQTYLRATLIV